MPQKPPVVLIIAGFDTSSGAGVSADLFALESHGVYGIAAITSIVTQSSTQVFNHHALSAQELGTQLDFLLQEYQISAVKIGLLPNEALMEVVATSLKRIKIPSLPIVLDPVIQASAGKELMQSTALRVFKQQLLPLCTLITPNLDEALILSKIPLLSQSPQELDAWSLLLQKQLGCDLLLKGGHLAGVDATDRLVTSSGVLHFSKQKISTPAGHGTGCRLASAIAACLAKGDSLPIAVEQARTFVRSCLENYLTLTHEQAQQSPHQHLAMSKRSC